MIYTIFRNNIKVASVKPDTSSELSQKKQQEDTIRLNFTLTDFVDFEIGDYILFEKTEQFYYLNKKPGVVESPKNFQYTCVFEGAIHQLKKTKIFLDTPKTGGGFYRDYKFPLTGNAETFLTFIVGNLNRNGESYTAGTFTDTATQNVEFNNFNAFEAINVLSSALGFSWRIEGTVLHFEEKTSNTAYVFHVGRKDGFLSLTRARVESEDIETVVYGYGSTQNLPPRTADTGSTYDSDLLTENRLSFEGVDGESKLTNNIDVYGYNESIQEFDDISPEFTGVVSAIDVNNRQIIIDDSIVFNIEDYKLSGIYPKITFLTGKLIGLTFNISYLEASNQITMDLYSDESGAYPNDIIFAEVGDQYKLFDIYFPEAYVTDAQERLEEATQTYIDKQSNPLESYSGDIDEEFIELYSVALNLGDIIRIISSTFGIDQLYEIKELKQGITNPNEYSVTFGDTLPLGLLALIKIANFSTEQSIYSVQKNSITNNSVTNIVNESAEWE